MSNIADRLLGRHGRRKRLADALEAAAIILRPGEFLVVVGGFGLMFTTVLALLLGPLGFFLGVLIVPLLTRVYVTNRSDKRRFVFAEQLPDVLQLLVSSLRSGWGLLQSLDSVSGQSPEPASVELQRVLFEVRIGRDLSEALQAMAQRMRSRDFDFVVKAIEINREVGGQLAGVLETTAETIRERQRLRRQIRVLTAEGRLSIGVLTALPVFLVLLLSLINHQYFAPLTKGVGPVLIAIAVVLSFLGWAWMRQIIKAQE